MNRKEFLGLAMLPLAAFGCRYHNGEEMPNRTIILEADLAKELLAIGDYKTNPTVGVFVRRKTVGQTPQAFECIWMICTHAKCVVAYKEPEEKFICLCHGSIFDKNGEVLQGPAAEKLKQHTVEINGLTLRVYA